VAGYHRDTDCETDDPVGEHDWLVSSRVFNNRAFVHQKSWHEQDCEKSDQSRKKNSESGHGNLRYFQRTSVPKYVRLRSGDQSSR
jgi:hypothetical protein